MIKTIVEAEVRQIILENSKPKEIPLEIVHRQHKSIYLTK
jgi:hypothetical protein